MNLQGSGAGNNTAEARWREEADFFDRAALRVDSADLPISPLTWRRYTRPVRRRRFSYEYRLRLLGDLAGRSVLDVGCGDGLNTVILARLGARVTGIDISPESIAVARRRAEANGVSDRVTLVCAPVEAADLPAASFDIVWGDGILHHVLEDLERVIRSVVGWVRPGGRLVFAEPVNLCPALRRLRNLIPVRTEATPGERPMLRVEIELLRRHIPDLTIRHYGLVGRLDRFILVNYNYERSSAIRRVAVNAINALDWGLLSLPTVQSLGGTAVLYGHVRPGCGTTGHREGLMSSAAAHAPDVRRPDTAAVRTEIGSRIGNPHFSPRRVLFNIVRVWQGQFRRLARSCRW